MIYYNSNTINDWYYDTSDIIKVYRNNAVCYYKVTTSGGTTAQTPCYAVVDDISQYSDTEFEDVFNLADGKWYKLNNLNEYEEYGIYGSGRTECTGDTPSRLPQGYTEVEYIENTGTSTSNGAYINTGLKLYDVTGNSFSISGRVKSEYYSASGYDDLETIINSEGVSSPYYGFVYRYAHSTHILELSSNPSNSVTLSTTANSDGSNSIVINCNSTTVTDQVPFGLFASYNGNYNTPYRFAKATIYSLTVVKNGTTVMDLVPAKRDSDSKYGLYDLITDTFYPSANGNNFVGGDPIYQPCVTTYEGKLTIDTESIPQPSRLPAGYTEVEYIEDSGSQYIDTGVYLDTSNFEVGCEVINSHCFWGYCHQNVANGTWLGIESSTSHQTAFYGKFNSSDINNISSYLSSVENTIVYTQSGVTVNGSVLSKSLTMGSDNIANKSLVFFGRYDFNANSVEWQTNSKFKSFYVKNNGTLVRDFVPAKRDSDDKYGMYDLITDTFYTSPNGNNFIGGSEVIPPPITATYEYMYSGGSWVNVGEVSGSSITIKSPEYIEKDSSHNGMINLDYVWKTNSKMQFKFYSTNNGGGAMIGEDGTPDNNDCRMFFASTTAYFDWGSSRISWSSNGRTNTLYEYEYGNYYIKNMATSASKTGSTISTSRTNTLYFGYGGTDRFRTYYLKFYDGDTLVKDFIPWTDMNGNYGLFDKVSLSVYNVVSGSLTGSSNVTDVEVGGGYEYPLEYVVREDPPNNVTFTSMTEAESYECPWVGMHATIDGDKYVFSGDSQSGYEWVYNPSRLPVGYTEVEYVQNTTHAYLDIGFIPDQDSRIVCDMQQVTTNDFPRLWGAGEWNSANGINLNYEGGYLQMSWFGKTSWTQITSVTTNNNRHTYDLNKNNLYVDETLVGSNTYTTKTAAASIGIFCEIRNNGQPPTSGNNPQYWEGEYFKGKLFSFQVYDNGTLVRDLVPCTRDNDNEVGAYDLVNNVFYTVPTGYTTDKLIAGNPV